MSPDTLPCGHLKLASWVRFRFEDFFQRNRLQKAEGRCVMNQLPRRILLSFAGCQDSRLLLSERVGFHLA
jgi:hypothetical protein